LKKVLITISGLHFQNDEGAKNRLNSFINSYKENDFEVKVLLFYSLSSFKYIFQKQKYLNQNAKWNLFPVLPIGLNVYLTKLSNLISQIIFGFVCRINKYEIIQSEVSGNLCKYKSKRDFLIVDFHGDSVSELIFRNNGKNSTLVKQFINEQANSIKYSNYVIGVSEGLIKQIGINTKKEISNYSIVSCGVDVNRFINAEKLESPKNLEDRIKVGYLGGLQKWQNIDAILTLVENLHNLNNKIFFVIYTNNQVDSIRERLDKIGKDNYMVKALKFDEVPSYLSLLDAGLLIRENNTLNIVSSPTKTAEYLAAGVPVICTKYSGDYKRSINHLKEGFVLSDISISQNELLSLNNYLTLVNAKRDVFNNYCTEEAMKRTWELEFCDFLHNLKEIIND
jgi:glycosyltransferase involved in cell wall biosynthesis